MFKVGDIVTGIKEQYAPSWSIGKDVIVEDVKMEYNMETIYIRDRPTDSIQGWYAHRFKLATVYKPYSRRSVG